MTTWTLTTTLRWSSLWMKPALSMTMETLKGYVLFVLFDPGYEMLQPVDKASLVFGYGDSQRVYTVCTR